MPEFFMLFSLFFQTIFQITIVHFKPGFGGGLFLTLMARLTGGNQLTSTSWSRISNSLCIEIFESIKSTVFVCEIINNPLGQSILPIDFVARFIRTFIDFTHRFRIIRCGDYDSGLNFIANSVRISLLHSSIRSWVISLLLSYLGDKIHSFKALYVIFGF